MSDADSFSFEEGEEDLSAAVVGTVSVTESRVEPSVVEHTEKDTEEDQRPGETSQILGNDADSHQSSDSPRSSDTSKSPISPEKEPHQGTIEELIPPTTLSEHKESVPRKRKSAPRKPRKDPKPVEEQSHMPVLNQHTENKDTYDIDYLLDMQKQVKVAHRFVNPSAKVPIRNADLSDRDYVRKNIENKTKPKPPSQPHLLNPEKLLPPAPTPKQQSSNFVQRLYQYRDQVQEKLRQAKEQMLLEEQEKCTFAPTLAKFELNRQPKQPQDFYYEGINKAKENMLKAALMRKEQAEDPGSFTPTLDAYSLKIVAKKGRERRPVYDNLFRSTRNMVKKQITEGTPFPRSQSVDEALGFPFKPTINKHSENLVKDKRGHLVLYESAKQRQQASVPSVPSFQPKLLSRNSDKVLQMKFEEEFKAAWNQIGGGEKCSREQVEKCLEALGFELRTGLERPANEIWDILQGEKNLGVTASALLTFLKAVLRFRVGLKVTSDDSNENRFAYYQDSQLLFTEKQLQRVQTHFRNLCDSRSALIKLSSPEHFRSLEAFNFHPEILTSFTSQRSSILNYGGVETRLLAENQRRKEKIDRLRAELERRKMAECTFTPSLRKSKVDTNHSMIIHGSDDSLSEAVDRNAALYRLAEVIRARKDVRGR